MELGRKFYIVKIPHLSEKTYINLSDLVVELYNHIYVNGITNLSLINIDSYFMSIHIANYKIMYNECLYMYNHENLIKVLSLYPEFMFIDSEIKKKFMDIQPKTFKNVLNTHIPQIKKNCGQTKTRKLVKKDVIPDEKFVTPKENPLNIDQELMTFESDKSSYILIKKDVAAGKYNIDEMHPCFILKYQIFEIMEMKGILNLNSNENLQDEYTKFYELYNECGEDEVSDASENDKIYVPHNYYYMTSEEKENFVKGFDISLQEFEEKYLNQD